VECSSVVFDEEENAHTEDQKEAIEFPDTTDEAQTDKTQTNKAQTDEAQDDIHEMNDTESLKNTSKSQISDFFHHTVKWFYERLGSVPKSAGMLIRKKKIASRASGCTRRSRRSGPNLANPDAAYHGTVHPDTMRHGTVCSDAARHGTLRLDIVATAYVSR